MKRFILTKGVLQWDEAKQRYITVDKEGYWYDGPMVLCMDTPTITQDSIQLFNDDGTDETDSTQKANVGVDIINQALDENILVRFLVKETAGNALANLKPELEIRLNGGAYQPCDDLSTIGRSSDSTKLTEGADTTQRIGSGTFVTPNSGVDDTNGTAGQNAINFVGNDETEFLYCFQVRSADVNAGENVEVRISDGQMDAYVDTEIKITIASGGPGPISASPAIVVAVPTADLKAKGKLDATPDLVFAIPSADLQDASGVGPIDAAATIVLAVPAADLKALGKLDASVSIVIDAPTVDLKGNGKLDATVTIAFGVPTADLTDGAAGPGPIDASPALVISLSADLKGKGKLDATPDIVFDATADLIGIGKLDATPDIVFGATGDLKGNGKLEASVSIVFAVPIADLINVTPGGAISASPAIILGATADLEALGKLDAAPAISLDATGNLIGIGKLDAGPQVVFGVPAADLKGNGQLSATPALVFSLTASLVDKSATQFYHIDVTAVIRKITITAVAGQIN